jgi:hypothetical protein
MELQKGKIYKIKMGLLADQFLRGVYMGKWKYDIYNEGEKGITGSHTFCLVDIKGGSLISVSKKEIANGEVIPEL